MPLLFVVLVKYGYLPCTLKLKLSLFNCGFALTQNNSFAFMFFQLPPLFSKSAFNLFKRGLAKNLRHPPALICLRLSTLNNLSQYF